MTAQNEVLFENCKLLILYHLQHFDKVIYQMLAI